MATTTLRPPVRVALILAAWVMATGGGAAAPAIAGPLSPYQNIPLWPAGHVPLATGDGPLDSPFLTVFLPPESKRNGGAVVIAPGGANIMLMYGAEGLEIAERYNDWGVTAFVLTYRLSPRYGQNARVLDGKRSIQLVRAHAAEWKLDPDRIGYIGFSAGSSMGRAVVAAMAASDPNAADPVDRVGSRPDYLALVYGAGQATPTESLKNFPPTFLVSAAADSTTAVNAATSRHGATPLRTAHSTWPATSWSGARTGTAATTTPSHRARTRQARTRARTASSAAGRSSSKPSISEPPPAPPHGRRSRPIG